MASIESALKKLKTKKVMKASELERYISTRTQLRRMVEAGQLSALGSGLYAHPSMDPFAASLIATARYYPKAVISNITALVFHGLSDERVDRIDVDIPRNSSIRNKLICAHRVSDQNIIGAILPIYHGQKIRIYCKERALCDAYRMDPDGPLFLKAMKRYVKAGEVDAERIAKYDKALSTNVLRSLRQELADE
ncbi:MAG: hypothetical protein EBQ85_01795 [Proteobacteria bacterium]|nr:hypothetical protein [Pseudomonadota bacterium]